MCIRDRSNLETIVLPCKLGSTASAAMCCGNTVVVVILGTSTLLSISHVFRQLSYLLLTTIILSKFKYLLQVHK